MNNIRKVVKQIEINVTIFIMSVLVIYGGQILQHGMDIRWKDGLNAELVFVMISSLGSVVGWRIVEGIKQRFEYNLLLFVISGMFCVEYGIDLVANNSEALRMWIFFSSVPFFTFYIFEQVKLLRHAIKSESKKKTNSLRYGER